MSDIFISLPKRIESNTQLLIDNAKSDFDKKFQDISNVLSLQSKKLELVANREVTVVKQDISFTIEEIHKLINSAIQDLEVKATENFYKVQKQVEELNEKINKELTIAKVVGNGFKEQSIQFIHDAEMKIQTLESKFNSLLPSVKQEVKVLSFWQKIKLFFQSLF